jgi:hypothetical protein
MGMFSLGLDVTVVDYAVNHSAVAFRDYPPSVGDKPPKRVSASGDVG